MRGFGVLDLSQSEKALQFCNSASTWTEVHLCMSTLFVYPWDYGLHLPTRHVPPPIFTGVSALS